MDRRGEKNCYCGGPKSYEECCAVFLAGKQIPRTPEQLMRSRYTAFYKEDAKYLVATLHPSMRKPGEQEILEKSIRKMKWLGLKILKSDACRQTKNIGYVEFIAFYGNMPVAQLHEKSRFIYEDGRWYYIDGEILEPVKFSRNEFCWCGSHKKYKKCHGQ